MGRTTIPDSDWWMFLGAVVRSDEGSKTLTNEIGAAKLARMEREGYLWIRPRGGGYWLQPTPEGIKAVRRWAARKAKDAAREFGR